MAEDKRFILAKFALEQGDRFQARDLLAELLKEDPGNIEYWLLLSTVVGSNKERIYCLNKVLEIDPDNMSVTVQAGITIWELNEHLAPYGLWLPHQPESKRACTIGASIGCDNDSTFGVRYGKILDCLTDAVVVTGRGEAVRLGHR